MDETQRCYVCGEWDELVNSRVQVKAPDSYISRVVAQCPRCLRFICSDHSERLDLAPKTKSSWFGLKRQEAGELTLCCPFDPCVPLGDSTF
jgi:hypothetical protein